MTEFEAAAELSLTVPERELRQARQDIQNGIGETSVGMTDGGTPSAQAAGGGQSGRQRRRQRRSYRMEIERTDHLEDIVELLHGLEEGDGGGDGLLGSLLGGAGAGAGGLLGGAVGPALGAAVGSAAGNIITDELSDAEVALEDDALSVEEPDWTPIDVDHPDEAYDLDHPEEPYALDHPEDAYTVDHPEEPYAVEHPEDPYAVDHPEEPYLVEDPSPLEVQDVPAIDINVHASGGGASGGGTSEHALPDNVVTEPEGAIEGFVRDLPGFNTVQGLSNQLSGDGSELSADEWRTTPTTGSGGGFVDMDPNEAESFADSVENGQTRHSTTGSEGSTTVTVDANQNHTINLGDVTVDTDLASMRNDIMDEVERMIDDAVGDLERQIQRG